MTIHRPEVREFSPTFESALVAAQSSVGAPRAASGVPGTKSARVPAELLRFGNGKIPKDALSSIGIGQHRLSTRAAVAFRSLHAAAAAEGINFGVTDSYRDYDSQVDLAKRKGLYSEGGLAARPGTSDHGWGLAVDLDLDAKALAWMRANAGKFGFVEDVPRESWHWTFHS